MSDANRKLRLAKASGVRLDIARRDEALVRGVLAGDADALSRLIDHYDRLIRYAIFRLAGTHCARDPNFLDARASEVWTGFVESVRRAGSGPSGTMSAYLTRIAGNKCNDHFRRTSRSAAECSGDEAARSAVENATAPDADPLATLIGFEQVETLRACIAKLPRKDRNIMQELELITHGRWTEAARRLGIADSTLRSRWKRVLGLLRSCVERNLSEIPEKFAPRGGPND